MSYLNDPNYAPSTHLKTVLFQHSLDEDKGIELRYSRDDPFDFLICDGDRNTAVVSLVRQRFSSSIGQPRVLLDLRQGDPVDWFLYQHPCDQIA